MGIARMLWCSTENVSPPTGLPIAALFDRGNIAVADRSLALRGWGLLLLEPLARELQNSAVLRDRAHHLVRHAGRDLGLHLQRYRYSCPDEARNMRNHLSG